MSGSMTGGVDSSIPLQAGRGVERPNPLQQIGQFVNISNAMNTGRLQEQAITRGKSQTEQTVNQIAMQAMLPLLDRKGPLSLKDLTDQAAVAEAMNLPTGGVVGGASRLPFTGDSAADDRMLRIYLSSGSQAAPESARAAALGTPVDLNIGPAQLSTMRDPLNGALRPGGSSTNLYPSRSEMVPRTIIGYHPGTGAQIMGPLGAVTPRSLAGPSSLMDNGSFPEALINPNRPAGASVTPSAAQMPGAVVAPSPAATAARQTTGTAGAANFDAISKQGVQARSQDAMLANMENDLERFTSGSGAQRFLDFKKGLAYWAGPVARGLGVDEQSIAAQESFNKLAAQIANAQGAGSDARMAVNQQANPSGHISPEGARLILKQLRGNADYLKAYARAAAAYPNKEDSQGFEANVAGNLNPQVFQLMRLSPSEKTTFFRSIPDAGQRARIQSGYKWAKDNGFLGAP